ncbi:hypothetical protein SMACR_03142 [Sordaria macrospora]|uniref:WGS project CABT00000000 data, contig 2.7 n=2 Tax=Sordaria macrospora TaxID=5147 RepID=F7VU41_SORMK|nr:uncharacterized protein SMAC_03142 [Sordaria macrospora k-hell]KAA8634383.1 hypothetical protein SMACR_03142 [Sordaria macrospora]KAH7632817.1 cyclin-like protein [Sordaria sp. MPI-SDFR-AT-0083]WPJ60710.1 hypothetical protein SMAC4_03142 [Sordaria macrospora]CCC09029.1 unnamed protein product [Sordaria macrospora k-hell]
MASEDARYRETSQFEAWSFSPAQLAAMREKTNALARRRIAERMLASALNPPTSNNTSHANTPDPSGNGTPNPNENGAPTLPDFLKPEEEALLVSFYVSELLRAADHLGVPDEVRATATVFFRRFFLTNSIMTYPPQEMILVALFVGSKAEGRFPRIIEFQQKFNTKQDILAGEFLLCQGNRFNFEVRHPFRALMGAMMELRSYGDIDEQRIIAAEKRAHGILLFSPLMTDAYFHYTPSQIMFAALSLADRGLAERLIQETFHFVPPTTNNDSTPAQTPLPGSENLGTARKDGGGKGQMTNDERAAIIGTGIRDKVMGTIEACRNMLSNELPERKSHWTSESIFKSQIRPVRKKLTKCRDPDRWNLSELQRQRREQGLKREDSEERAATSKGSKDPALFGGDLVAGAPEKKRRKVDGNGLEDPFGGPL